MQITVAIALPLSLPNRNVFYAVNFEANYNMPYPYNMSSYIIPGPLAGPLQVFYFIKFPIVKIEFILLLFVVGINY